MLPSLPVPSSHSLPTPASASELSHLSSPIWDFCFYILFFLFFFCLRALIFGLPLCPSLVFPHEVLTRSDLTSLPVWYILLFSFLSYYFLYYSFIFFYSSSHLINSSLLYLYSCLPHFILIPSPCFLYLIINKKQQSNKHLQRAISNNTRSSIYSLQSTSTITHITNIISSFPPSVFACALVHLYDFASSFIISSAYRSQTRVNSPWSTSPKCAIVSWNVSRCAVVSTTSTPSIVVPHTASPATRSRSGRSRWATHVLTTRSRHKGPTAPMPTHTRTRATTAASLTRAASAGEVSCLR